MIQTYPNNIKCYKHCVIKIDNNNIYSIANNHFILFNREFKHGILYYDIFTCRSVKMY